jgi:type IV secretory pathway VirB10-like protein
LSDSAVESSAEKRLMSAMRIVGLLLLLLTAGCAGVKRAPPPTAAPAAETVAVEPSVTQPTEPSVAKAVSPETKTPAKVPAVQPVKKPSTAPSPEQKVTSPPLDLTSLETRLKETKAIGVFTKITLKNQVDDLLNQFRAYYQGRAKTTLAELRQPYESLILKVLALLQDGDPELARAIVASREAIWGILADPAKFATL